LEIKKIIDANDILYSQAVTLPGRGEWGEMAVGQNAQIDFVCYSIALAN
jgi:hypothetical protein